MVLSAAEKLKILATGKATLKEINELEKQAEGENNGTDEKADASVDAGKEEVDKNDEAPADQPGKPKEDDVPDPSPVDEKDKKIAELEAQIKEMQKDNVNEDNSGSVIDTDTALLNIFKDFK